MTNFGKLTGPERRLGFVLFVYLPLKIVICLCFCLTGKYLTFSVSFWGIILNQVCDLLFRLSQFLVVSALCC